MGRVEDERDAARAAERALQKLRQEEQRKKESQVAETRFSERLVSQDKERARNSQQAQQKHTENVQTETRLEDSERVVHVEGKALEEKKETLEQARARKWISDRVDRWRTGTDAEEQRVSQNHAADEKQSQRAVESHGADEHASSDRGQSSKKSDAQSDALRQKKDPGKEKDSLGVDADGRGGKGKGNQQQDNAPPGTFRLNPALMAPVPVAKPKETSASERLRALANEIAQKIVERVRIGTNASGAAEFQIDLRSNVLSGLNIQVSGSKGRIKAVFSGRDSKVLKLLREQSDSLKKAMEGRGLKLEELRIEERP